MDIVEFAEKFYDVELVDWQKTYLRTLDQVYKQGNVRVVILPRKVGHMFTYFKMKELTPDGSPNDCK